MAIQNQIVFVGSSSSTFNPASTRSIYTMDPDGSALTELTAAGTGWFYAFASPDGTKLLGMKANPVTFTLFMMAADGSGATAITNLYANAQTSVPPTFSPDGSQLVLPYGEPTPTSSPAGVCIVNADNSGYTNVALATIWEGNANSTVYWSPDGAKLAFPSTSGPSTLGVDVCNIDGSGVAAVLANATWNDVYGWYSDSSHLFTQAMGTTSPFPMTLMKTDLGGSSSTIYTDPTETDFVGNIMTLSPDESKIVFFDSYAPAPMSIFDGGSISPILQGPPVYPVGGINLGGSYMVQWVGVTVPAVGSIAAGLATTGIVRLG